MTRGKCGDDNVLTLSEGGHSDGHGHRHEGRHRPRPPDALHM